VIARHTVSHILGVCEIFRVVDEFHGFKNGDAKLASNLRELRDECACAIVGLTGTLMQNDHKELWYVIVGRVVFI
jgi:SNF2 family DNA or RNA helicase